MQIKIKHYVTILVLMKKGVISSKKGFLSYLNDKKGFQVQIEEKRFSLADKRLKKVSQEA